MTILEISIDFGVAEPIKPLIMTVGAPGLFTLAPPYGTEYWPKKGKPPKNRHIEIPADHSSLAVCGVYFEIR